MIATDRQQLINWLNLFSVRSGEEFELSSGQKSTVYVDVKKTAQHHRGGKLVAKLLCQEIAKHFTPISGVAGVVLGGCHLASCVAMQYPIDLDVVFVRAQVKDHGTQQLIERPIMTTGQEIVLLEDVITTGQSAVKAARLLEDEGFIVRGILAVVDRRPFKTYYLNRFPCVSLVEFEELTA